MRKKVDLLEEIVQIVGEALVKVIVIAIRNSKH